MDELRLLRQWAEYMVAQGRSEGTIRRYRYAILRFLSETPRDTLSDITEQDVVVFLASLGKRAHSRQLYLNALRSFFEWAQQRGHITENPARHLHPKAPADPPPDAYTEEEIVLLVKAAGQKSERRALAITACYALGLRRSELCGIKAEDVDWHGRKVFIREAKGDKPRWVEMNDLARVALLKISALTFTSEDSNARLPLVGYAPVVHHDSASSRGGRGTPTEPPASAHAPGKLRNTSAGQGGAYLRGVPAAGARQNLNNGALPECQPGGQAASRGCSDYGAHRFGGLSSPRVTRIRYRAKVVSTSPIL